jgi:diadenosine tetraphosphate (Ap4A) HIT family hydrolase
MPPGACPLCAGAGGELIHAGGAFRVIRTDEGGFPAFYRVIWNRHVREFSDLSPPERLLCLEALLAVEQSLLAHLQPDKINLASLGNAVPHLHWHVIARFSWDSHFPAPVWAAALRQAPVGEVERVVAARTAMEQDLAARLGKLEVRNHSG